MPSHRETRQQGKQYEHEAFHHHEKGSMVTGGLERHESEGGEHKLPHERSHASCTHPKGVA